jgi:hypothetical protein
MSAVNWKVGTQVQSDSTSSLNGYDLEGGATEAIIDATFAANSTNNSLTMAFTQANLQGIFLLSDKGCTLKTNGNNTADVQTISITGTPTGGDFPLTFNGATTSVAFNSSNATVQAALVALSTIGNGNITCAGGPLPGTPIACTFAGTKTPGLQPLMTTFSGSLAGGSAPTVTIAHTTPGLPQETITLQPGIPLMWARSSGYYTCPFQGNVANASVTTSVGARLQGKILQS